MRSVALLSLLALSGCGDSTSPGLDAADTVDAADTLDAAEAPDALPGCDPEATGSYCHDFADQSCGSCHGNEFAIAGTLYTDAAGTSKVSGATVRVVYPGGSLTAVAGSNGVFYTYGQVTGLEAPRVSKCPTTVTMPSAPSSGDCNSCHNAGNRVHLP